MKDYTIDELVKFLSCEDCGAVSPCSIKKDECYKACIAKRLESQQKEIDELKKQITETYTVKQFKYDAKRMCENFHWCNDCPAKNECTDSVWDLSPITVKLWCASHPERPKMTNGDKFREVFDRETSGTCFRPKTTECFHSEDEILCDDCEFGINGEYKNYQHK